MRISDWSSDVCSSDLSAGAGSAQAAERLTLYCSPQIEWCQIMVEAFTKETGIDVAMTRKSSGETLAQIKAEASNPRGAVRWGGTGDRSDERRGGKEGVRTLRSGRSPSHQKKTK